MTTARDVLREIPDSYRVSLDDFEEIKNIGTGSYGSVFLSVHKRTGTICAVKKFLNEELKGKNLEYFCREISIMRNISSKCLIRLLGFSDSYPYLIITEFMEGGALYNTLKHSVNTKPLTATEKTCVALGIAYGMMNLHKGNIIHRDLKSLNILLDKNRMPVVCDLGVSRYKEDGDQYVTQRIGTQQWMAPEQLSSNEYTIKVDVYAYGILLWEILTEKLPYEKMLGWQVSMQVIYKDLRPEIPDDTPKKLKQLIQKCWTKDPGQRPSFKQIFKILRDHKVSFPGTDENVINTFATSLSEKICSNESYILSGRPNISEEMLSEICTMLKEPQNQQLTNDGNAIPNSTTDEEYSESDEIAAFESHILNGLHHANQDNVKAFFDFIIKYFTTKISSQHRTICIKAIFLLIETDKMFAVHLTQHELFKHLPIDNPDDFENICKILSAVTAVTINAITSDIVERLVSQAGSYTANVLHLFSKFVMFSNVHADPYPIFCIFLLGARCYIQKDFFSEFVEIFFYFLTNTSVDISELKSYIYKLFTSLLTGTEAFIIETIYQALIHYHDLLPPLDLEVIMSNIRENTSKNVFIYIINEKIKYNGDLLELLIKIAPRNELAVSTLCHIAELHDYSNLFLIQKDWLIENYDVVIAFRIFLSLCVEKKMRDLIMELSEIGELLTRVVGIGNEMLIYQVSIIIKKMELSPKFVSKLSTPNQLTRYSFTTIYIEKTLNSGNKNLVETGITVISELAMIKYFPELDAFAQYILNLISGDVLTELALRVVLVLIKHKELVQILINNRIIEVINGVNKPQYSLIINEILRKLHN